MSNTTHPHSNVLRRLAALGLLAAFALPSTGIAASPAVTPDPGESPAQCAMDDCAESTTTVQIDTLTGDVYLVEDGTLVLTDGDIPVHFGGQERVLLHLQYTVGEWEVSISSDGSPTETFETSGGALRYFIEPDHADYVITTTEVQSSASTMMNMMNMMNMAPVPPGEIIIMPEPTCPPS